MSAGPLPPAASLQQVRRATHNLHVLLEESAWLKRELAAGTYRHNHRSRLDNSAYLPLIESVLALSSAEEAPATAR